MNALAFQKSKEVHSTHVIFRLPAITAIRDFRVSVVIPHFIRDFS